MHPTTVCKTNIFFKKRLHFHHHKARRIVASRSAHLHTAGYYGKSIVNIVRLQSRVLVLRATAYVSTRGNPYNCAPYHMCLWKTLGGVYKGCNYGVCGSIQVTVLRYTAATRYLVMVVYKSYIQNTWADNDFNKLSTFT